MSVEDLTMLPLPDVDLSADVPCTMEDCAAPATWLGHVVCTGTHPWFPECDEHRAFIERRFARRASLRDLVCAAHGTRATQPFTEWRPL
jgi:hypothetical protein